MSTLRVDNIKSRTGSVVTVPETNTLAVTGIVSVTSSGSITNAGNLTNTGDVNVTGSLNVTGGGNFNSPSGIITAGTLSVGTFAPTSLDVSGNATVGGGLTVTGDLTVNGTTSTIDTVITAVDSLDVDGNVNVGAGLSAYGYKIEQGSYGTAALNGAFNLNLTDGHVQEFNAATSGNYYPNFRISPSVSLSSKMGVGDVTSATIIVQSSSHYCLNTLQVDGSASGITTSWIGGAAPSAANGSGYDIYAFTIMKTSATPTYHIIANTLAAA